MESLKSYLFSLNIWLEVCILRPGASHFTRARMAELEASGEDPGVSVSHGGASYKVEQSIQSNKTRTCCQVCYSLHPSLAEVESFVRHFSPELVMPLALPAR